MEQKVFEQWLREYGRCWENKEPKSFSEIFSEDVKYYWTPFDVPKSGREQVSKAFEYAVSTQNNIEFNFEILNTNGNKGITHWWCSFIRTTTGIPVKIDGILTVEMNEKNLYGIFREWWHREGD